MSLTLREIALLIDGQLQGDGELRITGAATIRDAGDNDITFADNDKALQQLAASHACAVIVGKLVADCPLPQIQVAKVSTAFAKVVATFRPQRVTTRQGVHASAQVSATARIAADVEIHAHAVIGDDVEIGSGSTIHSGAVIMAGCKIGEQVTIYPNAVLYEDTIVGAYSTLHAGCVIGAHGFGYNFVQGRHQLSPQLGYVEISPHVEIGACTTIDRGTYGATTIGEGTKIDNHVMIAHNCRIGRHNLICSQVGIAGSSTTGDYVVLAGQVGVRDHVTIHTGVQVGAQAGVMTDLESGNAYVGSPAQVEREFFQSIHGFRKLPEMRREFKRLQREVAELQARLSDDLQREAA